MRERYCRVCGGWHQLDEWPHNCMPVKSQAQSDLPAPHFVSDSIDIQSMHDGRHYTSKAKLRSAYRAAGVVEIGNEKPQPIEKPKADRNEIRKELRRVYTEYNA
ncbi:hypothetical protein ACC764_10165 [Rhizobium ruizarguesonis]|uniref:hypothetical protein n=1 Tax=Rhizobium ruizarguesonis TaxID=2081791 RepID=UPI0010301E46|nr:hypothetical protein [Rhizobium ruizarguesonis]TAZ93882.1 hypothetical protein ELH67_04620 [Rhizobium ruizarguesonis]TBA36783.1 hypothetical protein ELH60_04675 [Rhizobium ruizarguesonis]TBC62119.1 hypothetical protein ELH36_04665 [Rhizobium ruizarguesonis]WSH22071.1 hypothetical protein U8Q07_06840 [Rhizobium ruizarguesonis]WSH34991.1 hypothetical protein U8P70_06810 [Rhizobium ruizarguesonis]